jgi:hypothetical protein
MLALMRTWTCMLGLAALAGCGARTDISGSAENGMDVGGIDGSAVDGESPLGSTSYAPHEL